MGAYGNIRTPISPPSSQISPPTSLSSTRTLHRFPFVAGEQLSVSDQTLAVLLHPTKPLTFTATANSCETISKPQIHRSALYRFGRRQATWLRVWFLIGVGSSVKLVLGVSFLLLWSRRSTVAEI